MIEKALEHLRKSGFKKEMSPAGACGLPQGAGEEQGGSTGWIPFASYCTTGQFMKLDRGFKRHCGPTAAVNVILTLERRLAAEGRAASERGPAPEKGCDPAAGGRPVHGGQAAVGLHGSGGGAAAAAPRRRSADQIFLMCAGIGRKTLAYWNTDVLGRFGGTSNFLAPLFLRRCLQAAGLGKEASIRFHPWITPDAVSAALEDGTLVYLQVYRHPKYRSHHMLCYACRPAGHAGTREDPAAKGAGHAPEAPRRAAGPPPARQFLLADGWTPWPVWIDEGSLGHGHFLTVRLR